MIKLVLEVETQTLSLTSKVVDVDVLYTVLLRLGRL